MASLEATEARFAELGLEQKVESLAADGKFVTGPNLEAMAQRKTTFYGPIAGQPEIVKRADGRVERQRDQADETACASCPLRAKCLQAEAARRTLSHDQYEPHRVALRVRMTEEKSSDQLTRRQSEGERPFAVIKQQMSLRQLLLRGHEKVTKEWHWMKSSANTQTLIRWCRQHGAGLRPLLASFAASVRSRRRAGARASPSLVGL